MPTRIPVQDGDLGKTVLTQEKSLRIAEHVGSGPATRGFNKAFHTELPPRLSREKCFMFSKEPGT